MADSQIPDFMRPDFYLAIEAQAFAALTSEDASMADEPDDECPYIDVPRRSPPNNLQVAVSFLDAVFPGAMDAARRCVASRHTSGAARTALTMAVVLGAAKASGRHVGLPPAERTAWRKGVERTLLELAALEAV